MTREVPVTVADALHDGRQPRQAGDQSGVVLVIGAQGGLQFCRPKKS